MSRFASLALSAITALSLSLTPIPAAAADREDIAKVIAGLALLGIVAHAANEREDRKQVTATRSAGPNGIVRGDGVIRGEIRRHGNRNNQYHGVRRAALPDRCVRILSTARGDRAVYGARCLRQDYIYANQLPSSCKLQVRTNNRIRHVYGARCLRRDGWRVLRF